MLAIPPKRTDKVPVTYIAKDEAAALLAAPDRATRIGRRDHAVLLLALETGLRVSELTGLTCAAVQLGAGAHVRCTGKGRKERITPLRREARAVLRAWLDERGGMAGDPLFPGPKGGQLSRDAVRRLVERHVATATLTCPSLAAKDVTRWARLLRVVTHVAAWMPFLTVVANSTQGNWRVVGDGAPPGRSSWHRCPRPARTQGCRVAPRPNSRNNPTRPSSRRGDGGRKRRPVPSNGVIRMRSLICTPPGGCDH